MRALIIDDSSVMRKVVERTLRQAGLELSEVLHASDGEQALQVLRDDAAAHNRLDLIVSDINMPVMNGVEFLERKLAECLALDVPVLVIATEACHALVQEALAAGAQGYINKPFTAEQVKGQIQHLLCAIEAGHPTARANPCRST